MLRSLLLGVSIAVTAFPALAQYQGSYQGHYSNNQAMALSADLVRKDGDRYSVKLSTVVPINDTRPGCAGSVEGEAVIKDKRATMRIKNEGYDPKSPESAQNQAYCEIKLTFLDKYKLKIEEVSGCSYYHGAACSFSGVVEHDASGI